MKRMGQSGSSKPSARSAPQDRTVVETEAAPGAACAGAIQGRYSSEGMKALVDIWATLPLNEDGRGSAKGSEPLPIVSSYCHAARCGKLRHSKNTVGSKRSIYEV